MGGKQSAMRTQLEAASGVVLYCIVRGQLGPRGTVCVQPRKAAIWPGKGGLIGVPTRQ
jgi:hypothetical protein